MNNWNEIFNLSANGMLFFNSGMGLTQLFRGDYLLFGIFMGFNLIPLAIKYFVRINILKSQKGKAK